MKLAVLADIHSNYVALEKCMDYAVRQGVHHFLFLGDYIGEFAYPERTMERLKEYDLKYDCVFIRGNKEDYWLNYHQGGEKGWPEYNSTTGALYYAYHHLTGSDLCFFSSLPIAKKLQYEDLPTIIACHGTPDNVKGNIKPAEVSTKKLLDRCEAEARQMLEETEVDFILHGHTHVQQVVNHKGKVAINPGSVGLGLQAGGRAEFAILHGENGRWSEELVSLDYDRERVIRELYISGLSRRAPYWCQITERLLRQTDREEIGHAQVLVRAMELCKKETGTCTWPYIPEKYWEQAMGM